MHKFPSLCEFVAQMDCDECDREREEFLFEQQSEVEAENGWLRIAEAPSWSEMMESLREGW